MPKSFWLTTLGCPKNSVDSDKLVGRLLDEGLLPTDSPEKADVLVVNTCAFVELAREESIDTILDAAAVKMSTSKLVVTGCLAERYGQDLARELPEVDLVAGFGVDFASHLGGTTNRGSSIPRIRRGRGGGSKAAFFGDEAIELPMMDLLNLPRKHSSAPWAYLKVAEGCDKKCGFCAIPAFRGKQVSREIEDVLAEGDRLDVREIILVAQDLANYGRDIYGRPRLLELYQRMIERYPWVRLVYLYPSELTDPLIEAMASSQVPYFDLSLQHVSRAHLKRMRRFGRAELFMERIQRIRTVNSEAAFRSNFIVGYPGETEEDHRMLVEFVEEAQLDWVGFFTYSIEDGTYGSTLSDRVPDSLALERLNELTEIQDSITRQKSQELVGARLRVLVDQPGMARSFRQAPEIDGIVEVDRSLSIGKFYDVRVTGAIGPDLTATAIQPELV